MPAQLIWTNGTSNGNWKTAANWTDPLGGPSVVPGATDYAYFGNLGSNTPCLMNASSATVDRIIMDGNYTSIFTLGSGNTLTTANQFVQYGDFVFGGTGTLNVGGSLSIYGEVSNTPMMGTAAVINVSTDVFLQTGGIITATSYFSDTLDICCLAFDHDGTINVGTLSTKGAITITGDFYQWNSAVTNVFGHSTLTFDSNGNSANDPTIAGTINLGDATAYYQYGFASITTDTHLYLNGGTLQTHQYNENYIFGDVSVDNGGELILGTGSEYSHLILEDGDLYVGGSINGPSYSTGTLTINPLNTLSIPAAANPTEFIVYAGWGLVNVDDGFISMNAARVDTMRMYGAMEVSGTTIGAVIVGNVSVANGGVVNVGSTGAARFAFATGGLLTVGADSAGDTPTSGELNLFEDSLLDFQAAATDMFVVTSRGVVNSYGAVMDLDGGTMVLSAPVSSYDGGMLRSFGADILNGSLINSGQFRFEDSLHTFTIIDDYTQDSDGELYMRLNNGEESDLLDVGDDVELDGLLDLSGITSLTGGQDWVILLCDTITGDFGSVIFPDANPNWLATPLAPVYFISL